MLFSEKPPLKNPFSTERAAFVNLNKICFRPIRKKKSQRGRIPRHNLSSHGKRLEKRLEKNSQGIGFNPDLAFPPSVPAAVPDSVDDIA